MADTGADARPLVLLGIAWLAPVNSLLPSISAARAARAVHSADGADVSAVMAEADAAAKEREQELDDFAGEESSGVRATRIRGATADAVMDQGKDLLDRGIDPFFVPPAAVLPKALRNGLELAGRLHSLRRTPLNVPVISKPVTSGGLFGGSGSGGADGGDDTAGGGARGARAQDESAGRDTDARTLQQALSTRSVNHRAEQQRRMWQSSRRLGLGALGPSSRGMRA